MTEREQMDRMVFRKTNAEAGRNVSVTPLNSTNRHLNYGRIILNAHAPSVRFSNGECETGFIVLSGSARIRMGMETFELGEYDGVYIPRDSEIEVSTQTAVDIAEFFAPVSKQYPLQIIRHEDVEKDPALRFTAGGPGQHRTLSIVLGKNVEAGRLIAGFTRSEPGNWTSWPPH